MRSRWIFALLGVCAIGCARQIEMSPQSQLDTAQLHYQQGMRALEEGDVWSAQTSFERARGLDEDFPGVAVGTALVENSRGEFFRARKLIEGALHRDRSFVDAHVALARIETDEGLSRGQAPTHWIASVRRSMSQAAELAPLDGSVPFRLGEMEFAAGQYGAATTSLQRAISLGDSPWDRRATELLSKLQVIERTAPGSPLGGRLATADVVTRGELAVLLIEELQIEKILAARRRLEGQPPVPVLEVDVTTLDIEYTWARPFIERLVPLGILGLEPLPDGRFDADAPVTRAQLAMVADGLLQRVSGGRSSSERYLGEPSRFSDISSDHYAYPAIASVVARGVMAPDAMSMTFRPTAPVDGAEALDVLKQLQTALTGGH